MRTKNKKVALHGVALSVVIGLAGGCVLDLYGEAPVDQSLYFPISMAAA